MDITSCTMDNLEEAELFTVNVFQSTDRMPQQDGASIRDEPNSITEVPEIINKPIAEFQNMVSARVIKGRMLELEHSNLAGPSIKFKTVVNYERTLEPNSLIGLIFKSQDGYIAKSEDD